MGLTRISLGLTFLWAFIDKLIGLGFTTCRDEETGAIITGCENAWLNGGSPTTGFLKFATQGPFADIFKALAGSAAVDWLFMAGLLGVGMALTLGVLTRIAIVSGVAMLLLMYLATLPPEHHPFIDEHIIYSLVLLTFLYLPIGDFVGFGRAWSRATKGNRILR